MKCLEGSAFQEGQTSSPPFWRPISPLLFPAFPLLFSPPHFLILSFPRVSGSACRQVHVVRWALWTSHGSGAEPRPQKHFGTFWAKEICRVATILVVFVETKMYIWRSWSKSGVRSLHTLCERTYWYNEALASRVGLRIIKVGGNTRVWGTIFGGSCPCSYAPDAHMQVCTVKKAR